MNGSALPKLALLPAQVDPLDWAAKAIAAACRERLPDLSHLTLVLPAAAQIPRLRRCLNEHCGVLLGPRITTLAGFAAQARTASSLSVLDCKLILCEALRQFPDLFAGQDAAALADALFGLFEELSAATPELAEDEARFVARIERGYGSSTLAQASQEARFVHLLWRAYLRDTAGRSPAVAYLRCLHAAFDRLTAQEQVILIGFDDFSVSERAAIKQSLGDDRVQVWLHGPVSGRGQETLARLAATFGHAAFTPDAGVDAYSLAFDDSGVPLRERAAAPNAAGIRIAAATQPEHEARMVDVAIRRALLAGARDVTVVTQDRRLARRLRALLERARIPLRDEAGWALSTSAAAASLGHWLDCCDQGFPFRALLDLLKSGFFELDAADSVAQLEKLIYRHEVAGGIDRYRKIPDAPKDLLSRLEQAARLLPSVHAPPRSGADWSQALMQSLRALPLWQAWQDDAAGVVLIRQIEELHAALQRQKPRLDWAEFRRMLERLLESATFIPQPAESPVRLLTLEQAQGLRCDFLIIAGASAAQFPGKPAAEVVFNHSVRAELGLPHWNEQLTRQLARFRSLLHAAPQIFVTYAAEDEDEAAEPCPWVEALRVVGLATPDLDLPRLAASAAIEVATAETELPGHQPAPRPPAPAALIPASLSAGAHQALIDCPYKFFASACLGLRAAEEPDEPVSRRDFGERVHLILQAFHEQVAGLPPAFAGAVTAERRVEALEKLQAITLAVLRDDLRNRALAQVWLAEIQTLIPELVNWLIARSADWPRVETEAALERALTPELKLHGRVDRLEHNPAGDCSVVDYKTGEAPRTSDVEDGEAIQATHYALLAQPCTRVEYLLLGGDRKPVPAIEGDALAAASTGVRERLKQIFVELRLGAPLPAQGDELTCSRCDFSGLCRVGTWHE